MPTVAAVPSAGEHAAERPLSELGIDEAETVPYRQREQAESDKEEKNSLDTIDIQAGPDPGGQVRSPASWEAQYEDMRRDEHMALRAAVEDEEYEQAAAAEAEWEAQYNNTGPRCWRGGDTQD